jgi:methyl-accepting chemotaxis protein
VVAEEVRNLAQRSAQAAGDVSEAVQKTLGVAVCCAKLTGSVSAQFDGIREHTQQMATRVNGMASAAEQQAEDASRLQASLDRVRESATALASAVQESAGPLNTLEGRSEQLDLVVRELASAG